jgi:CRP-like cAMP-binding protein
MPQISSANPTSNCLLARLSLEDMKLVRPYLEAISLPLRQKLEVRNRRIDHVYFPESGFASVVATGHGDSSIEVALIGREGMTGLAVLMGTDRSPNDTFIQYAGAGLRIPVGNFHRAIERSPSLHKLLLRYGHAFVVQASHTALANARSNLEGRLSRWLLMAHDRIEGDELSLTHEFLSVMLGVRRPGVTVALKFLVQHGLIKTVRGVITILDRKGMERSANGAYGVPEAEFLRLFG